MRAATIDGRVLGFDEVRGTAGMVLFIATEAFLFVSLFFAYFYLGRGQPTWPPEPPKLTMALVLAAILVASSAILHEGEGARRHDRTSAAAAAVWTTVALGVVFLVVQAGEVREKLSTLTPQKSAYGSIFFTITGFHAAHLILGLFMLTFVGMLPRSEVRAEIPTGSLRNVSLYWHFVDVVWILIVAILYVLPKLSGRA
jgi:heme/copper-type cytochrome/quinol oxidase subunit 3